MLKLGICLSGTGRTLENLMTYIGKGKLDVQIRVVVSSKSNVRGVTIAAENGIPTMVMENHIFNVMRNFNVDLVCLCGYIKKLEVPHDFNKRVINIHPSLLPAFGGKGMYGMNVHKAVVASGVTKTGCTVHFVNEEYDEGEIILQKECPVYLDDTQEDVAKRVFELECEAYPEAINLFSPGKSILA